MAANIIKNFKNFEIFLLLKGGKKKNVLDFLEIEKTFVNKKGATFQFMAKSQFSLNYIGYFSKKLQKSASHFRGFSSILPKVQDRNPRKSVWYLF